MGDWRRAVWALRQFAVGLGRPTLQVIRAIFARTGEPRPATLKQEVRGLFGGGTGNPISGRFGGVSTKEVWLIH